MPGVRHEVGKVASPLPVTLEGLDEAHQRTGDLRGRGGAVAVDRGLRAVAVEGLMAGVDLVRVRREVGRSREHWRGQP